MTDEEAIAWVVRRTSLWNAHDAASLAADHASHSTVHTALAGVASGRAQIKAVYQRWFAAFPDLHLEIEHPLVHGDRIAVFWTMTGTQAGPFLGVDPIHQRLRWAGAFLYEVLGTEIVYERRLADFTGVFEAALDPSSSRIS